MVGSQCLGLKLETENAAVYRYETLAYCNRCQTYHQNFHPLHQQTFSTKTRFQLYNCVRAMLKILIAINLITIERKGFSG